MSRLHEFAVHVVRELYDVREFTTILSDSHDVDNVESAISGIESILATSPSYAVFDFSPDERRTLATLLVGVEIGIASTSARYSH